ncbi:MAG TPA: choice-of-anchor tandem repeat GloVer-containing protein, partial [Rhizomicrobium sp.]|nr:choice-of-anchor tandem repeat GloVer-containing protein [Rhizomicrobium sp.]
MHLGRILFHGALLGSALAAAASAPAVAASASRADLERTLAVTGRHSSARQSQAPSRFIRATRNAAYTYTVLHDFAGAPGDGAGSGAEVALGATGNIYGTTDYGGANTYGTIFEITPDGKESLLHSFGGAGDGSTPDGAVTIESNGDMYGTTSYGGSSENGVIWKLAADGTYTVVHNFSADECNFARGRLVQDKKGNFYTTCLFGGANLDGTVIKFTPKGKVTVLHNFVGTDGEFPEHNVVMDKDGNIYGVTAFGGASDNGTIYEIAGDGTFTSLYSFTGGADGGFPYGAPAIDENGNLYGSADDGGAYSSGTVFELTAGGTYKVVYNFTGGADGEFPEGDMLLMGKNLYSTTTEGGANGQGGVYEVTSKR